MRRRATSLLVACTGLLLAAGACTPDNVAPHTRLETQLAPLRDAFNAAADRVRLVLIASPT